MKRSFLVATIAVLALTMLRPETAEACAISRPLSDAVLAQRAAAEGEAWREAAVVYVARIAAVGDRYETFTLEPVRVLRGMGAAARLTVPPEPSPGLCLIYQGLTAEYGGSVGDEFVVYAWDEHPTADSRLLIVSTSMLGDPATRTALERTP